MIKQQLGALAIACALAYGCSDEDSNTAAGEQSGAGSGGASGAGDATANAMSGGAGGAGGASGGTGGVGGMGGSAASEPSTGGMNAAADAMIEDDANDSPHVDAGEPAPFQSIDWPSDDPVVEIDMMSAFGTDVSGITYRSDTLWLSMNLAPTKLYKMEKSGASWQRVTSDSWDDGKELLFPDGSGIPDAEGVTLTTSDSDIVYIGSERNLKGANAGVSHSSVLSYDPAMAGDTLTALQEWNLTPSLPAVGANQGLEAVTWIPDESGSGLFVVGLESQSDLYFFALGSDGSVDLVATIATELTGIMGLEYDASVGYLWAYCDDTCDNRAEILSMLPSGEFARRASVAAPATLPNINNEGIAIAPDSECSQGVKAFYWVEDGNTDGHVLRAGTVPCGAFLER